MADERETTESQRSSWRTPGKHGPLATTVSLETAGAQSKTRRERLEWWTDLLAVLIVVTATVAASWSGYQAARWGGVQSIYFTEASGKRVESTRASAQANTEALVDISLFDSWLEAYARDDQELASFLADRFRAEFKPAFEAWLILSPRSAPDSIRTPFELPQYKLASQEEADRLEQEASDLLAKGKEANQQSDDYVLNTVILVSVLFFGGIAQRFNRPSVRSVLIVFGFAMLIYGLVHIATYPIH